jgi:hypothetical protein
MFNVWYVAQYETVNVPALILSWILGFIVGWQIANIVRIKKNNWR